MKTKRWTAMLAVLLGVMVSQDALAFYNSSTGRWIYRDPIGEAAFQSRFGQGRSSAERRELHRESLEPSYVLLLNQGLNSADFLGLRQVCTLVVRASHLLSGGNGAYDHYNSTDWSAVPAGDAVGYISCGANTLNDGVAQQNRCAGIPGMYRNQGDANDVYGRMKELMDRYGIPYEDYLEDVPAALDTSLEAAKSLAKTRCGCGGPCGSCKNVRIVITCDRDTTEADQPFNGPGHGDRDSGTPKCGKKTTLDCKTGNFSMLR